MARTKKIKKVNTQVKNKPVKKPRRSKKLDKPLKRGRKPKIKKIEKPLKKSKKLPVVLPPKLEKKPEVFKLKIRKNEITCILTGVKILLSRKILQKQAAKLKFDTAEEYAQYYICRDARKLLKEGHLEKDIRKQFNCQITKEIPLKILKCYVKKFKSRENIERKRRRELANTPIPYSVSTKKAEVLSLNNPAHVAILTTNACWRPDFYLNNDRTCVECSLYENCQCKLKRLPKKHAK